MAELTEAMARWLLTEDGEKYLTLAQTFCDQRAEPAIALGRLRKTVRPEQAAAAWEMALLRHRAHAKFGEAAARMFFVREALEQASGAQAAAYHARRFAQAGFRSVTDLCGGIGGDALAFAQAGLRVTLVERDPVRALLAQANAQAIGLAEPLSVVAADAAAVLIETDAVWFDPARRTARGRINDPEDYHPPLSVMASWAGKSVGAKLAPAIDLSMASGWDASLEFVSDSGECKEALLWTEALRSADALRAVRLTEGHEECLATDPEATVRVASPDALGTLYEPDPAVIRAQGVATLAERLRASLVAPQIAYLLGETLCPTPFATAYRVLERFPFSRRRLQDALHRHHVGQVIIKKRGFPQEPEDVRRSLTLRGSETMIVILTRASEGSGHQVLLCRRLPD